MKKHLLLAGLSALAIIPTIALAGYDTDSKPFADTTTIDPSDVVDTDYIKVYRTGDTSAAWLPALSIGGAEVVSAASTLSTGECGKTTYISSTTGFATTLPDPTLGCELKFVVSTDSTGTNHTIITDGGNDIIGFGLTADINNTADPAFTASADTISFASATAVQGDGVTLSSDGTYWYAVAFMSTVGGVTFSSAI